VPPDGGTGGLAGTAGKVPSAAPIGLAGLAVQVDLVGGRSADPGVAGADSDAGSRQGADAEVAPPGRSAAGAGTAVLAAAGLIRAGLTGAALAGAGVAGAGVAGAGVAGAGVAGAGVAGAGVAGAGVAGAGVAGAGVAGAGVAGAGVAGAEVAGAGVAAAGLGGVGSDLLVKVGHGPLSGSADRAARAALPVLPPAAELLAITGGAEAGTAG
jgi:hypothetical protein